MRNGRRKSKTARWLVATTVVLIGYSYWTLGRPLPLLQPEQAKVSLTAPTAPAQLKWPAGSQAALGVLGTDIKLKSGVQKPVPTASTAKIITSLVVLDKNPLGLNQAGPMITMTTADEARYRSYVAQDGSVVPVKAGEQLSQYQMLQTILLPSANNMADGLAIWAYGSLPAYQQAANAYLAEHDLIRTHVGSDASGLAPDTTSTAEDLVALGKLAMQNPVIAQIAAQAEVGGIPMTTSIKNVNNLLGTAGIIGLKTGNSDHAGGAFVGAAKTMVNGKPVIIVTAVLGAPNRPAAMSQSLALIQSAEANFKPTAVVKAGSVVGYYKQPWGGRIPAITDKDLTVSAWQGSNTSAQASLKPISAETSATETVGSVSSSDKSTSLDVRLRNSPTQPSVWWRLSHPIR